MHRPERIAETLREEIAQIVGYELEDPRLTLVTVTEVRVADDLADSPGLPPLPQTAGTTLPSTGSSRAVGLPRGVGRRIGGAGVNLVGSGISHYLVGRNSVAGVHHALLLDLVTLQEQDVGSGF